MPTKTKPVNPAYPDAHPTAPGGMSKANLRLELKEKHGISMDDTRETSWPDLIDMVIEQRKAREQESLCDLHEMANCAECNGAAASFDASLAEPEPEVEDMFEDLDAMLAEYEVGRPGDITPVSIPAVTEAYSDTALAAEEDEDDGEFFDPESLFEEMQSEYEEEQANQPPPIFLGIPGIADYVFDGHAGAGPSASERWINCTMSLKASRTFLETLSPNQQRTYAGAGIAARQGTTAHAVAEAKANHMLGRIDEDELDSTLLSLAIEPAEGEEYDDEMDEYVNEYIDLVTSLASERGVDRVLIESRVQAVVPLTDLHEDEFYVVHGSADCIGMPAPEDPEHGKDLVVVDLKYGDGIFVEVERNPQVRFYALGALDLLTDDEGNLLTDIETVTYYIAQPRLGGLRSWTEPIEDLLEWRDNVLGPALTQALYPEEGATFTPGEVQCQWCPARGSCPALAQQRMDAAADLFDVIIEAEAIGEFPETGLMDSEQLGDLLTQSHALIKMYNDMKEEAERRLYRGEKVPGWTLVNYSPPRKWKGDLESTVNKMRGLSTEQRRAMYKDPALVTPTQAEKILGKEDYAKIEALVEKPNKRPVIAPEGDRRTEWEGNPPEAMFDDESTDEDRALRVEEMFPDE